MTTQADADDVNDTLIEVAKRGVKGLSAGDKRVDYIDVMQLRDLQKSLDEDVNGGIYNMVPEPKGYF